MAQSLLISAIVFLKPPADARTIFADKKEKYKTMGHV
jgi:hypothetical protein